MHARGKSDRNTNNKSSCFCTRQLYCSVWLVNWASVYSFCGGQSTKLTRIPTLTLTRILTRTLTRVLTRIPTRTRTPVQTRGFTIPGGTGSPQEVRRQFSVLLEDVIRQPDISKYVSRFQLAVQEAKVKMDLAISQSTWLTKMAIKTESTAGYNNKLKHASISMKLGV